MSLEPRALTLLKTLVERYIAEGQPVGSRALSKLSKQIGRASCRERV